MQKPVVVVTRKLPEAVEARLRRDYTPKLNDTDRQYYGEELLDLCVGADAVLPCPTDRLTGDLIARLPDSIKIIATFSVGYDHIDVAAAQKRNIVVANTPDVLTDATADIALLLILGASRRAYEGENLLRAGRWYGWEPTQLMGMQITGKRLGILGMGRIGRAVAQRARAFGMHVHYHNRTRLAPELEVEATFHETAESLLAVSDVLSLHCPATPETHHFLDERRIELLPKGAVVVNTARGTAVKDEALIAALKSGRVAAAGLDVFEGEPKVNPAYYPLQNCMLLPHMGSATVETRNAMGFRALDNLDAFFADKELPSEVKAATK